MKNISFLIAFFLFSKILEAQIIDSVAVDYNATTQILKVHIKGSIVVLDPDAIKSIDESVSNDTVILNVKFKPCSPWQMFTPYDTIYATSIFLPPGQKILKVLSITLANTDTSCYYLEKDSHYDSTYVPFNMPIGLTEEHIEKVNIYPNPNNGCFFIDVQTAEKINFAVYSATGRLIIQNVLPESKQISLEQFQSGVYFLRLKIGENYFFHKIIMQ